MSKKENFLTTLLKGLFTLATVAVVGFVLLWLIGGVLIPAWEMFVVKK